ncbi:hypothetical protein V7S43_013205 [Phytophthora oleae]|uniref:Uncharacterized protein n=1 Tax=Phytophthora oleae TaxID=2107226 RepID=A0ABD3F7H7_9STRA
MGGRTNTSGGKRPAADSPTATTFTGSKRMTGRKRLDVLQENMAAGMAASGEAAE